MYSVATDHQRCKYNYDKSSSTRLQIAVEKEMGPLPAFWCLRMHLLAAQEKREGQRGRPHMCPGSEVTIILVEEAMSNCG